MHLRPLSVLAVLLLLLPGAASAASWEVDAAHSKVAFSVDHFFTPVPGSFEDYDVDFQFDQEKPENSTLSATIRVDSVDTGVEKRDQHLLSADFFEAEKFPTITFESTEFRQDGENRLVAIGNLMIKGKRQRIELPIEILGIREIPPEMQPNLGGSKKIAGFRATTTLDRSDFGVGVGNFAATTVVGEEVDVVITAEAHYR